MFSKVFLLDLMERALKTVAQTALALFAVDGVNILTINWQELLVASVTAGVISTLTSIASTSVHDKDSASLVGTPPTPTPGTSVKG